MELRVGTMCLCGVDWEYWDGGKVLLTGLVYERRQDTNWFNYCTVLNEEYEKKIFFLACQSICQDFKAELKIRNGENQRKGATSEIAELGAIKYINSRFIWIFFSEEKRL